MNLTTFVSLINDKMKSHEPTTLPAVKAKLEDALVLLRRFPNERNQAISQRIMAILQDMK